MNNVLININKSGHGFFSLDLGNNVTGKIRFNLHDHELIILDTIVPSRRYLDWIGSWILNDIVAYARMHELKIVALSKFVHKTFRRNPLLYVDVWENRGDIAS